MTVAFDAVASDSVSASSGTTLSWTHTPVGTPTAVGVSLWNYEPFATITGITYGGVAMTQAVTNDNEAFLFKCGDLPIPLPALRRLSLPFLARTRTAWPVPSRSRARTQQPVSALPARHQQMALTRPVPHRLPSRRRLAIWCLML